MDVIPIRAQKSDEVRELCAGQNCPSRVHCLRYKIRRTDCVWASYDIERVKLNDKERCPAYVDNWMRRGEVAGGGSARVGTRRRTPRG